MSVNYRKRPCRNCRKWFQPSRRGGHHQKTCGQEACKREWHRKKCRQWRRKNPDYGVEERTREKMERLKKAAADGPKRGGRLGKGFEYPRGLGKEVMGVQISEFVEVILKVLYRGLREVIRVQAPARKWVPP